MNGPYSLDEGAQKQHWEEAYAGKQETDVSWRQERPDLSLQLIDALGLSLDAPIIDAGGGASALVDGLIARGYRNVTVLDIAESSLALAKSRMGNAGRQVEWIVGELLSFRSSRKYQLWHDRAVFHFLTEPEDRRRYVEALVDNLEVGAAVIMATFALDGPERCSGLPVERYDAAKLQAVLGDAFALVRSETETHTTPWGAEQRFAYFQFRRGGGER